MDEKVIKSINEARWADGQTVWNRLEDITFNPMQSQEEFVMRLIRENAKTAFGRNHGFEFIRSMEEYRQRIHVTTYEDYIQYIERIVNGERNVLTAYLTEHLSLHHGYKVLPQSRWGVQLYNDYNFCAMFYIAGNHGLLTDGMVLNLVDNYLEQLPSGVYKGNLLGRLLTKREFDHNQLYVIPVEIPRHSPGTDFRYLQALYALKQKYISIAICEHYEEMLELLRYIEKHWPRLADDIERGNSYVQSDPERANAIREIMGPHHIGSQMVAQLWPGLHCIMVYDVDHLSTSFELLRTYCGTNVHFVFTGISSPEGTFTTAINLDDPQGVLIPDSVFYEFKPKDAKDYDQLLTLDQLEIGRSYELIISTLSGLYRYKTQKVLSVVGRYHDTPTVIVTR